MNKVQIYQGLTAFWEEVQDLKAFVADKIDDVVYLKSELEKLKRSIDNLNKGMFDMLEQLVEDLDRETEVRK